MNRFIRVCLKKRWYGLLSSDGEKLQVINQENKTNSSRQVAWQVAKEKYTNYENILYSSYLERHLEPANRWKYGHKLRKIIYPSLDQLRKQLSIASNNETYMREFTQNWMEDYEFYEGAIDKDGNINAKHGTPDPKFPSSEVPCNGCGAHLHCMNNSLPGYIPSEIFKGRTELELQTIICQRCYFLKHYNIALDVEVTPEFYVNTIAKIQDKFALAIVIVDLVDFPCSIWPKMQNILGSKRPVFIVGNKVDLLPRDCNSYLEHIKSCLRKQFIEHGAFDELNIKHVGLISAKTGYGIEELITKLQKIWKYKGDVYLMGCTNVGKSTLFNILLNSDYSRPEVVDLVRKATTCPWPGTTLQMLKFPILRPSDIRVYERFKRLFSERSQRAAMDKLRRQQATKTGSTRYAQLIGTVGRTFDRRSEAADTFAINSGIQPITTLNERKVEYRQAKWCYDTPGVMHPEQFTNLLTTEELMQLQPTRMISPRAYRLKINMTLFLAGLGRLDFVHAHGVSVLDWIKVFVFSSLNLPVVITQTDYAQSVYKRYLGTEILGVPINTTDGSRLERWPGLQCKTPDIILYGETISNNEEQQLKKEIILNCDLTMSSAGWLGLALPNNSECVFRAWTPYARGIYIRTPALIPFANRLIGKRIRNSFAYNMERPFVYRK